MRMLRQAAVCITFESCHLTSTHAQTDCIIDLVTSHLHVFRQAAACTRPDALAA